MGAKIGMARVATLCSGASGLETVLAARLRDDPDGPLTKTLFIKTYGCQMNVYDSARMADVLAPLGYAPADAPEEADLVILNTCHIREKAAEKVYLRARPAAAAQAAPRRREGRDMIIAVAGCVAQAEGAEIVAPRAACRHRASGRRPITGCPR